MLAGNLRDTMMPDKEQRLSPGTIELVLVQQNN
jgi:hypothetical protein